MIQKLLKLYLFVNKSNSFWYLKMRIQHEALSSTFSMDFKSAASNNSVFILALVSFQKHLYSLAESLFTTFLINNDISNIPLTPSSFSWPVLSLCIARVTYIHTYTYICIHIHMPAGNMPGLSLSSSKLRCKTKENNSSGKKRKKGRLPQIYFWSLCLIRSC